MRNIEMDFKMTMNDNDVGIWNRRFCGKEGRKLEEKWWKGHKIREMQEKINYWVKWKGICDAEGLTRFFGLSKQ